MNLHCCKGQISGGRFRGPLPATAMLAVALIYLCAAAFDSAVAASAAPAAGRIEARRSNYPQAAAQDGEATVLAWLNEPLGTPAAPDGYLKNAKSLAASCMQVGDEKVVTVDVASDGAQKARGGADGKLDMSVIAAYPVRHGGSVIELRVPPKAWKSDNSKGNEDTDTSPREASVLTCEVRNEQGHVVAEGEAIFRWWHEDSEAPASQSGGRGVAIDALDDGLVVAYMGDGGGMRETPPTLPPSVNEMAQIEGDESPVKEEGDEPSGSMLRPVLSAAVPSRTSGAWIMDVSGAAADVKQDETDGKVLTSVAEANIDGRLVGLYVSAVEDACSPASQDALTAAATAAMSMRVPLFTAGAAPPDAAAVGVACAPAGQQCPAKGLLASLRAVSAGTERRVWVRAGARGAEGALAESVVGLLAGAAGVIVSPAKEDSVGSSSARAAGHLFDELWHVITAAHAHRLPVSLTATASGDASDAAAAQHLEAAAWLGNVKDIPSVIIVAVNFGSDPIEAKAEVQGMRSLMGRRLFSTDTSRVSLYRGTLKIELEPCEAAVFQFVQKANYKSSNMLSFK